MTQSKPSVDLTSLSRCYGVASQQVATLLGQAYLLPPEEMLHFFLPKPEQMASLVLSLFKFDFPPQKAIQAHQKFATQLLANSRSSKRHFAKLSWPALEWLSQRLCLEVLGQAEISEMDLTLQLFFVQEELAEFSLEPLVRKDIEQLGLENQSRLHAYYYQGQLDKETLMALLNAHGYQKTSTSANSGWLEEQPMQKNKLEVQQAGLTSQELLKIYWLIRRLAFPLPWAGILKQLASKPLAWQKILEKAPQLPQYLEASTQKERMLPSNQPSLATIIALLQKNGSDNFSVTSVITDKADVLAPSAQSHTADLLFSDPAKSMTLWPKRPYDAVILVEGTTEAILLPLLARLYPVVSYTQSAYRLTHTPVIPAGGKNQMMALYQSLSETLAIPITILLDQDAQTTQSQLNPLLRPKDRLSMITAGEIEDLYDLDLLIQVINWAYHPYPTLTRSRYQAIVNLSDPELEKFPGVQRPINRVSQLRLIWQMFGLGRFDKVHLAQKLGDFLIDGMSKTHTQENSVLNTDHPLFDLISDLYRFSSRKNP